MPRPAPSLQALLTWFFSQWLAEERNVSGHTVAAYSDAWRQFLLFVSNRLSKPVPSIRIEDLAPAEITAFLSYLEKDKGVTIGTRNCRLAAIRSFFGFVAQREPALAALCAGALSVPTKRYTRRSIDFLDRDEVLTLLA